LDAIELTFQILISGADNNAVFMDEVVLPLTRRCMLNYDARTTEQFNINEMQREYVTTELPITEEKAQSEHSFSTFSNTKNIIIHQGVITRPTAWVVRSRDFTCFEKFMMQLE
jgi:hypothetical protein